MSDDASYILPPCEHVDCKRPAFYCVHWPGQTRCFCDWHTAAAKRVATAMGFALTTDVLPPPCPVCHVSISGDRCSCGYSRVSAALALLAALAEHEPKSSPIRLRPQC